MPMQWREKKKKKKGGKKKKEKDLGIFKTFLEYFLKHDMWSDYTKICLTSKKKGNPLKGSC